MMGNDKYEEIKDEGPSPLTRRMNTATHAANSATKRMTKVTLPTAVALYKTGWEGCANTLSEVHFDVHQDENVVHQLQEDVHVPDRTDELEVARETMDEGIDCMRTAWNSFSEVGQRLVVNPLCNFLNIFAQNLSAENMKTKGDRDDERQPLKANRHGSAPTSYGEISQRAFHENTRGATNRVDTKKGDHTDGPTHGVDPKNPFKY